MDQEIKSISVGNNEFYVTRDVLEFPYIQGLTTQVGFAVVEGDSGLLRGLANVSSLDREGVSSIEKMLEHFRDPKSARKMAVCLPNLYLTDSKRSSELFEEFKRYLMHRGIGLDQSLIEEAHICEHCDVVAGGNSINSKTVILENDSLNIVFYNSRGKWMNQRKPTRFYFNS